MPGDDISCLNLLRPTRPRLLGVPAAFTGFDALKQDLGPDVIPAVADANSATWILKLGVGDEFALESESGRPVRIRLVGLLERSLFPADARRRRSPKSSGPYARSDRLLWPGDGPTGRLL